MATMQPPQIGSGDDITTNNITTMMEMTKKKRLDCTGDMPAVKKKRIDTETSTATEKKRKDCTFGTNTPTVIEQKKRTYKRKDCRGDMPAVKKKRTDTNTSSTVIEQKKRTHKRRDCRGDMPAVKKKRIDTNTSTATEKKRKDCCSTNTPTVMEKKKRRKKYLPHDLIMEEILTKLPVPTLLKSVMVSRLWYNSIHNDHKRLTYSHFLESQKRPQVIFSLLNVREYDGAVQKPLYGCHFFKFDTKMYKGDEKILKFDRFRGRAVARGIFEMVGYCRGLPCVTAVGKCSTSYMILDPNREDFLCIFHPAKVGKAISKTRIICHGFGFDTSANEYKLVSIFRTPQKELNFLVFTLGTKSWRNVTATTTPVLGRPVLKIRVPTGSDKSAIFCSGCLVWKIMATLGGAGGSNSIQPDNNNEIEMLLSFNLHDDKICFIQLPSKRTTEEHLLVDYPHILEFMGSPCIARIEKKSGKGSDYPHLYRDGHQGIGSSNSCCCCCCKVHLYVLKDKDKQVWVKEESFDVCTNSTPNYLTPDPCCFCFGSTTTRILSFSGQIFLYWFNGKHLQVYNLHSQRLQLVLTVGTREDVVFWSKRKEPRHMNISGDDDIYCSNIMDYQLHCHEENYLSLETFIPGGVEGVDAHDFSDYDMDRCWAYGFINRSSRLYFPSYK